MSSTVAVFALTNWKLKIVSGVVSTFQSLIAQMVTDSTYKALSPHLQMLHLTELTTWFSDIFQSSDEKKDAVDGEYDEIEMSGPSDSRFNIPAPPSWADLALHGYLPARFVTEDPFSTGLVKVVLDNKKVPDPL